MLFVLLCLFTALASCAGDAKSDLSRLQADFFDWRMSDRPFHATTKNIHKYDDQLRSSSLAGFNASKEKADGFLARLEAIPTGDLSKGDMVSYRILKDMLSSFIAGYPWRLYKNLNPVNYLEGPQAFTSFWSESLPFFTRGDFENYIVRLKKMPTQFNEYKDLMREAIRLNRTNHNVSLTRLEASFKLLFVDDPTHSVFYIPFKDTLDNSTVDPADRAGIRSRAQAAVANVIAAFRDLWDFIVQEYMPRTRPQIAISSLHQGAEYYQACMDWYLSVPMTADDVHKLGLREVDRIAGRMHEIMEKQGFRGSIGDYFKMLMADERFFFSTGDEILEEYRNQVNNIIEPKLSSQFLNLPNLPIVVRPVDVDGPMGYYFEGSEDGSRPGTFWANVLNVSAVPKFNMMPLTMHETNPGHHLQFSYMLVASTPNFRRKMEYANDYESPYAFPQYTAYVEGWALYSESLGEELNLYRDDYELMGRYSSEIFRACRLVVDTGIHVFGWERDRAIQYFVNYTSETYNSIAQEIDRYITWPGQALAYKIGEIKIMELRDKARNKLGDRFDIRKFHAVVLENGILPLSVLEDLVNEWLESYDVTTPTTCAADNVVAPLVAVVAGVVAVLIIS